MNDFEIVEGNLDYLNFKKEYPRSLLVNGDILSGIEFKVNGTLKVYGNVENVKIKCSGDVIIENGFLGQNEGLIIAKGKFSAKYVQNGFVRADRGILIEEYSSYSNLLSQTGIEVKGRGLVVGGSIYAKDFIVAKELGSDAIVETNLHVGYNFIKRRKLQILKDVYADVKHKIEQNENAFKRIFEKVDYPQYEIDLIMKNLSKIDEKRIVLIKLLENIELKEKLEQYKDLIKNFEFDNIANLDAYVECERIHPGVNIFVLDKVFRATSKLEGSIKLTRENVEKWQQ